MNYDAYEITPMFYDADSGLTPSNPGEPIACWTLLGYSKAGGVEAVSNHPTYQDALNALLLGALTSAHPILSDPDGMVYAFVDRVALRKAFSFEKGEHP